MTHGAARRPTDLLVLNAGSSSLRFGFFRLRRPGEDELLLGGSIEHVGARSSVVWIREGHTRIERTSHCRNHAVATQLVLEILSVRGHDRIGAVVHRVVHGGDEHVAPEILDEPLLASLHSVEPFPSSHLSMSLLGIETVRARHPDVTQIACFDTAFHAQLPEVSWHLPLPQRFSAMRRAGSYGLSYEHVMDTLGIGRPRRLIIAHLGHGAGLVAIEDGRPIDTTMGFSPSGGILQGTRSGDVDPGVAARIVREVGVDAFEHVTSLESGLLAVGGSSDMRLLLQQAESRPSSALAVEMFGFAVRKTIGAYAAALGGVDLLVFTGGIGEHSARVRADATRSLGFLGIELDEGRNARSEAVISAAKSRAQVRVIAADEERVMAGHARRLLAS